MKPGDKVTWRHVPRGGWGYVFRVPAVVVSVGTKTVRIRAKLTGGGEKTVRVRPENLEEVRQ